MNIVHLNMDKIANFLVISSSGQLKQLHFASHLRTNNELKFI